MNMNKLVLSFTLLSFLFCFRFKEDPTNTNCLQSLSQNQLQK